MSYNDKIEKERSWHTQTVQKSRIWHNPLFFSMERILFNYRFPRQRLAERFDSKCSDASRILVAPCGSGEDLVYLNMKDSLFAGIDISREALIRSHSPFLKLQCDIREMCFQPQSFDCVLSTLFFHHYDRNDYHMFLNEIFRVLRPGGVLLIMEPSIYYPLNILTRPIKKIFKNPYGEVEDEGPIDPSGLVQALTECDFQDVQVETATFSHCSFFRPLANVVNLLSKPLLRVFPFSYCGWFVIFSCRRLKN